MNLDDWTVGYIKNRDIFFKKLVDLKKDKNLLEAEFKDKTIFYFCQDEINEELITKVKEKDHKFIVCTYKIQNMDFVTQNWEELIEISDLTILFVDVTTGRKLLLNPQNHSKVADPEKIKEGLHSIYEAGLEN